MRDEPFVIRHQEFRAVPPGKRTNTNRHDVLEDADSALHHLFHAALPIYGCPQPHTGAFGNAGDARVVVALTHKLHHRTNDLLFVAL